ncbi:MAG TPA: hypothetical protein VD997_12650 [Phycisphaerales bacterium]|nr:hypothetical protein [Phycisphaerales bacterium]
MKHIHLVLSGLAACVAARPLSAQPTEHANLHAVKDLLAHSQTGTVGIVIYGDSRSAWARHRVPGGIFRQWDVQWAALAFEGNQSNVMTEDGIGQVMLGLQDVQRSSTPPGAVVPGAGWMNRFPNSIAEQWVLPGTDMNLWTGFMAVVASTSGGWMHSNAQGAPGGTFFRGDPSQGRAVESVEYYAMADNTGRALGVRLGLDVGGDISYPWAAMTEFAPPLGASATPSIVTRVMPTAVAGANLRVIMAHRIAEWHQYAGRGNQWIGTRINFAGVAGAGQVGCVLGVIAVGGWSITDHLPATITTPFDNADWKYGEAETAEWYAATIRAPRVLLRWEVGANPAAGFAYESTMEDRKRVIRLGVQRNIDALRAGGAQEVVVELVPYYGSFFDAGGPTSRVELNRRAMRELAIEEGWSFYDQLGVLQAGGYAVNGGAGASLPAPWTEDGVHQSFEGMNLLQALEWQAIQSSLPPCLTQDFNGDGDMGTDADIEAFFACLGWSCCPACPPGGADYNLDGDTGTDADIEAFFRVLGGGCR